MLTQLPDSTEKTGGCPRRSSLTAEVRRRGVQRWRGTGDLGLGYAVEGRLAKPGVVMWWLENGRRRPATELPGEEMDGGVRRRNAARWRDRGGLELRGWVERRQRRDGTAVWRSGGGRSPRSLSSTLGFNGGGVRG